jgi:hypothetical protein
MSIDKCNKKIDWTSVIPHVLTIAGFVITIIVFFSEQTALRKLEHRNTMLLLQRETLTRNKIEFQMLAESIGTLSAVFYTNAKDEQQKAVISFYKHYFGSAFMISDPEMMKALNLLHLDIKNYKEGKVSLIENLPPKVRIIRSADYVLQTMKSYIGSQIENIEQLDQKLLEL